MTKTLLISENMLLLKHFKELEITFPQSEARTSIITQIGLVLVTSSFIEAIFTL